MDSKIVYRLFGIDECLGLAAEGRDRGYIFREVQGGLGVGEVCYLRRCRQSSLSANMILWAGLLVPAIRFGELGNNLRFSFFLQLVRGLDEFLQVDFLFLGHISCEDYDEICDPCGVYVYLRGRNALGRNPCPRGYTQLRPEKQQYERTEIRYSEQPTNEPNIQM